MATRDSSSTSRPASRSAANRSTPESKSAFTWESPAVIVGAVVGGAALALAANAGRKLAVQAKSARKGNWADSLAAEHRMLLELFDQMLATDDSQTMKRKTLLIKLGHALDKHAYAEEHVIYPALREANDVNDAENLETEHGLVKEFLYRLNHLDADSPRWLPTARKFRDSISAHARIEEDEIFPRLRSEIDEALDDRLTKEVNRAGFMMA